jgi:hypothetical protein
MKKRSFASVMQRLPQAPGTMNTRRVVNGRRVIDAFTRAHKSEPEHVLTDLLADLMHWAKHEHGADYFDEHLNIAACHFNVELTDEE